MVSGHYFLCCSARASRHQSKSNVSTAKSYNPRPKNTCLLYSLDMSSSDLGEASYNSSKTTSFVFNVSGMFLRGLGEVLGICLGDVWEMFGEVLGTCLGGFGGF